jgi:ClpP class serine protease
MNFDLTWLLWAFLILSTLSPLISRWRLEAARTRLIRKIEHSRNSRVITLIHRQETVAFLGIPVARYIDIEDSEEILRAVRLTDPAVPLDIILHTPGGLVLAAEQIAHALIRHKAPVTVFVPHYAMSGGTLLALSADNIVLDPNAVLGPVDPQLGEYPAASVLEVLNLKPVDHIDDRILILADVARKAIVQVKYSVRDLLISNGMEPQ